MFQGRANPVMIVLASAILPFGDSAEKLPESVPEKALIMANNLPRPHYEPQADDPPWFAWVAQFHGHLGPWVVLGFRLGEAARRAVQANGFFDVDVVCYGPLERPPVACFLDGVQLATGATWGKRNIARKPAETVSVELTHLPTGRKAIVKLRPEIVNLVTEKISGMGERPESSHGAQAPQPEVQSLARELAKMDLRSLCTVEISDRE